MGETVHSPKKPAAATLQAIQAAGAEGRAFRVSVLDAAAPTAMVHELEEAWGASTSSSTTRVSVRIFR